MSAYYDGCPCGSHDAGDDGCLYCAEGNCDICEDVQ